LARRRLGGGGDGPSRAGRLQAAPAARDGAPAGTLLLLRGEAGSRRGPRGRQALQPQLQNARVEVEEPVNASVPAQGIHRFCGSAMKEAFRAKNFRPSTLDLIEKCNAIIAEYGGQKITLRQLYYQFIARDLFPDDWIDPAYNAKNGLAPDTKNTEKNYDRLGERVNDARLAGLIDWDAIEDRGRQPVKWREFSGPVAVLDQCTDTYRRPRCEGQQHYVELWCEKDALAGVLAPTAWKHHVTMQVNKGYSSQSAMHEAAQRFRRHAGLKPVP